MIHPLRRDNWTQMSILDKDSTFPPQFFAQYMQNFFQFWRPHCKMEVNVVTHTSRIPLRFCDKLIYRYTSILFTTFKGLFFPLDLGVSISSFQLCGLKWDRNAATDPLVPVNSSETTKTTALLSGLSSPSTLSSNRSLSRSWRWSLVLKMNK